MQHRTLQGQILGVNCARSGRAQSNQVGPREAQGRPQVPGRPQGGPEKPQGGPREAKRVPKVNSQLFLSLQDLLGRRILQRNEENLIFKLFPAGSAGTADTVTEMGAKVDFQRFPCRICWDGGCCDETGAKSELTIFSLQDLLGRRVL